MNQNHDSRIHIALTPWDLTDDYNRHAGVTMLSALEHCPHPATVHLLYDEKLSKGREKEEAYNKSCYQQIAEKYGCQIQYHHIELPEWVNEIPAIKKWTPGSLLRLYLPKVLGGCDRVIYFDCDMVIQTNIAELWNLPLGNTYIAACPDSSISEFSVIRKLYYKRIGISYEDYFCSGILIINLRKLRENNNLFEGCVFSYLQNNPQLKYPDQDMLNWYCQENYLKLDEKYNIYTTRNDAFDFANDGILHYATKVSKPWIKYNGRIDDYYWNYLSKTPWCEDRKMLISYIRDAPDIDKTLSLLQKDFFSYLNGTKNDEIKDAIKLVFSICKSVFLWILNLIK